MNNKMYQICLVFAVGLGINESSLHKGLSNLFGPNFMVKELVDDLGWECFSVGQLNYEHTYGTEMATCEGKGSQETQNMCIHFNLGKPYEIIAIDRDFDEI